MFDFDLSMRIWRGAMDAAFAYAEAAVAGAAAFQNQLERGTGSTFDLPSWPIARDHVSANAFSFGIDPMLNPWAMTAAWWQSICSQNQTPSWPMASWMQPAWPPAPNDLLSAYLAWQPWQSSYARQPIMFTLMAFGMPFGVANPMARATTSMLDASDAMRQQAAQVFGDQAGATANYSQPDFWRNGWLN